MRISLWIARKENSNKNCSKDTKLIKHWRISNDGKWELTGFTKRVPFNIWRWMCYSEAVRTCNKRSISLVTTVTDWKNTKRYRAILKKKFEKRIFTGVGSFGLEGDASRFQAWSSWRVINRIDYVKNPVRLWIVSQNKDDSHCEWAERIILSQKIGKVQRNGSSILIRKKPRIRCRNR